mgnify:CR=1 FL=1
MEKHKNEFYEILSKANVMKMNIGGHAKTKSILKYDGTPFLPRELTNLVKEEI